MNWLKSLAFVLSACFAVNASAQQLPVTELKVLGGLSTRPTYKEIEQPFWTKTIPAESAGQVTAEIKAFDEMGLKGPELFKLLKQGVIEFGVVPFSYSSSEFPISEAIDLAGLTTDIKSTQSVANAFLPTLSKSIANNYQTKLLGVSPYAPQVLFCNFPIKSLQDLRGKKVRTVTRSQSELIEALGAKSTTIAFNDVSAAFKKKTIACAVGGGMAAYGAKWYSVATHIYALPVGWNMEAHAVNQKAWDQLDPEVQSFLIKQVAVLTESLWKFSAQQMQLGYDCNTGAKGCPLGLKGKMVLVRPSQTDLATIKRLSTQKVATKWAARCSAQCVADFNQTIGKSLKFSVKK